MILRAGCNDALFGPDVEWKFFGQRCGRFLRTLERRRYQDFWRYLPPVGELLCHLESKRGEPVPGQSAVEYLVGIEYFAVANQVNANCHKPHFCTEFI